LRPQSRQLFSRELEHKILGKSLTVTPDLLVEALGGHLVEGGELGIEQHLVTAQNVLTRC
jgi:hypothetical protein